MSVLPKDYWDTCRWYLRNVYPWPGQYPGRYYAILNSLEVLKSFVRVKTVLEIGCLDGYGLRILEQAGYEAVGIEIYSEALRRKISRNLVKASAQSLPFRDDSFDVVISAGVLEHIHRAGLDPALTEMERVGRKNLHRIHMKGFGKFWSGS